MLIIRNKKAISIPIVLLVIFTIIITSTSLFYFVISKKDFSTRLIIPNTIDSIYLEETYLDYYLNEIFERSINDFSKINGKEVFIENFKSNLIEYKDKNGNYVLKSLREVEVSLDSEDVILTGESLVLNIDILISESKEIEGYEVLYVSYNYENSLEKVFKV